MASLDQRLRASLQGSIRSVDADQLFDELVRRRSRRVFVRRVQAGALAAAVVVASVGLFLVLSHTFGTTGRQPNSLEEQPPPSTSTGVETTRSLPNNGMIAYSDINRETGDGDVFVMDSDGTSVEALHQPGDDYDPSWAPDGSRIFFMKAGKGIWVMDTDGSHAHRVSDHDAAWLDVSPDGARIAFDWPAGNQLWIMNADGSDPHLISGTVDESAGLQGIVGSANGGWHPSWSPDGTRLAFGRENSVWVMNADGADEHLLAHGDLPVWSPDGSRIAYLNRDADAIEYVSVDAMGMRDPDTDPVELARITGPGSFRDLAFSPDGTQFLYTFNPRENGPQNYEIFVMDADGGDPTKLSDVGSDDHGWCCLDPDWQPVP